jgi:hypothetical protein
MRLKSRAPSSPSGPAFDPSYPAEREHGFPREGRPASPPPLRHDQGSLLSGTVDVGLLSECLVELTACRCNRCRDLLCLLANEAPLLPSVSQAAGRLGFRSRHQLARHVGRHRLPPFQALADWTRVLYWVASWEGNSVALSRQNWDAGTEPSVGYRTVLRATGLSWLELRRLGFSYCCDRFRQSLFSGGSRVRS